MKFKENKNKKLKIWERALEECIKQFDFSNDIEMRKRFKRSMIRIAIQEIGEEEGLKYE